MVTIKLPDGSERNFDKPVTGVDIAKDISKSLAKSSVAMLVDGNLSDLNTVVDNDSSISLITPKNDEYLDLLRHSSAHLLAQAVKELYGEKIQVTIGPVIKDGFYYDFATNGMAFKPEDLEEIEKKMKSLVLKDLPIIRKKISKEEGIKYFSSIGEDYKVEIIKDLPNGEDITTYSQGDFCDLCRGAHLPSTGRIGTAFKLTKISGAYWRGDSNNEMLQRIYGTSWSSHKELESYIERIKEAERRDHRKLGRVMDLYSFNEHLSGSVCWHPRGYLLYRKLENYMRMQLEKLGYFEVNTPQMADKVLWERSGHWDKFRDDMFFTGDEDRVFAIKPMSCPGHMMIYGGGLKSYKDLPFKVSEFGMVSRKESSGSMHGLMRLRSFTQDDAHIYCTLDQVSDMIKESIDLIFKIYSDIGFENIRVKFSDRPDVRVGTDEAWDLAEKTLREVTESCGIDLEYNKGEGAFYGPKLEFVLVDAIGRDWQCGTVQLDFMLPERFQATYIDEKGERQTPAMIHRAIFGSMERFIGILIENYAGNLPLWLAPLQIAVCTVVDGVTDYAKTVVQKFVDSGMIVEADYRNEKINYKIREHSLRKIPIIFVIGKNEEENGTVSIRRLGSKDQEVLLLDDALNSLLSEVQGPYSDFNQSRLRNSEMPRYFTNAI